MVSDWSSASFLASDWSRLTRHNPGILEGVFMAALLGSIVAASHPSLSALITSQIKEKTINQAQLTTVFKHL